MFLVDFFSGLLIMHQCLSISLSVYNNVDWFYFCSMHNKDLHISHTGYGLIDLFLAEGPTVGYYGCRNVFIKNPSPKSPELLKVLSFKPGVSQNIAVCALHAARNSA